MNCVYHADAPNVAFCIQCGQALCSECIRKVLGSVYCEKCLGELLGKKGAGYDGGRWFSADSKNEVVLGFEAAEYEQRKVGDTFYASLTPAGKPASTRTW